MRKTYTTLTLLTFWWGNEWTLNGNELEMKLLMKLLMELLMRFILLFDVW